MTGRDALDAAASASDVWALGLLLRLIRAGRDGEDAVNAIVAEEMAQLDLRDESFDYAPRTAPLVAEFAADAAARDGVLRCVAGRRVGRGGGRSLLLFAHPDVEPYRPARAWRSDPFTPEIRDGRLHGWGVADDLAGVAAMLWAWRIARDAGLDPRGDIALASAPSKAHARGIAAYLHRLGGADAALYLHPAESGRGLDEMKAFTPGQLEFEIEIEGVAPETSEPAHTAFAHLGRNPAALAAQVLTALARLDADRAARLSHPRLDAAIGRSVNVMPTQIRAESRALSRFAERCVIGGAMTLLPGERFDDVQAELVAALAEASDPAPRVRWLSGVSGAETAADDPFFRTVESALRAVGAAPAVNPLHTSSDIRNPIVQAGAPTIGFGPLCGGLTMSGLADEWVDLADFRRGALAAADILRLWTQ